MAYVFLETQSVVLEMSLQPMVATQFYQVESYVAELYSAERQPPAPPQENETSFGSSNQLTPLVC